MDLAQIKGWLTESFGALHLIEVEQARLPEPQIFAMLERFITEDRVFGVLAPHKLSEFFDPAKLAALQAEVAAVQEGLIVVLGGRRLAGLSGGCAGLCGSGALGDPATPAAQGDRQLGRRQPG
ncbi:hypothetical protein D3C76_1100490 [compost metagenome]